MRVRAADHRLGVGLEPVRAQEVVDEPAHRAARVVLERARGDRVALAHGRQRRRFGERAHGRRGPALAEPGHGALPLRVVGGGRRIPGDVGQRASRGGLGEPRQHPLGLDDEEGARLRVAVLVGGAGAEHEQPLGAGRADVEEVALALELVLALRQHEPRGRCERAAVVVAEKRLGGRTARELALLEPADEDRVEAPGPDLLRRRHLDAVGLWVLAGADLEVAEQRGDLAAVDGARVRGRERVELAHGGMGGAEGPGIVQLGAGEHVGLAAVRAGQERLQAPADPGQQLRHVARVPQRVDGVEPERADLLVPQLDRLAGAGQPGAARARLEPVGKRRDLQHAGRAQVGEHVLGGAVWRGTAQERQQPAADGRVLELDGPVDRERDPVRAEDLLDDRRVGGRVAEHDGDGAGRRAATQQREHLRARTARPLPAARPRRAGGRRRRARPAQGRRRTGRARARGAPGGTPGRSGPTPPRDARPRRPARRGPRGPRRSPGRPRGRARTESTRSRRRARAWRASRAHPVRVG